MYAGRLSKEKGGREGGARERISECNCCGKPSQGEKISTTEKINNSWNPDVSILIPAEMDIVGFEGGV